MDTERKLISNNSTKCLLFCLRHVVMHTCQVWAPCSGARWSMKGHRGPIKGPIEIRPRAGQRATVWAVEIWHRLTEATRGHAESLSCGASLIQFLWVASCLLPRLDRQCATQAKHYSLQSTQGVNDLKWLWLHFLKSWNVLSQFEKDKIDILRYCRQDGTYSLGENLRKKNKHLTSILAEGHTCLLI